MHNRKRLGVTLAPSKQLSVESVGELARLAESLGYHSVWIPETWGVDAVSLLAVLVRETKEIHLASGILNVYSRSAALIAQTAATLQNLSQGRFLLGLGTSGPIVVEDWHGVPYHAPLQRTRDYVTAIRLALRGERVNVAGEQLHLKNFRLLNPPSVPVPIYIAALSPKNVRLAAELADGWLPIFAPRGRMNALLEDLQAGARRAGKNAGTIDVAAYVPVLIGPSAERLLRQQLAYYVGAMGTFYARFVGRLGFEQEVSEIRGKWQSGDRIGAVRAVPDELLATTTLGSDPETARRRIRQYRGEGVALPILALPDGCTSDQAAATLHALSPDADDPSPIIRS